ncbi:MAG TPA: 2Fe-2S iron-sulfur cluster-binding protein [Burkholderiaceae bacterium]
MSHARPAVPVPVHAITWQPTGQRFEARADETILKAALRALAPLRSSCRNGTCRTCMCRLGAGAVVYEIEWPGLSPEERHDGFVLPCVARATTDVVLLDER